MKVTIDMTARKLVAFLVATALVAAGLAAVITWLALRGDEPPAVGAPAIGPDPPPAVGTGEAGSVDAPAAPGDDAAVGSGEERASATRADAEPTGQASVGEGNASSRDDAPEAGAEDPQDDRGEPADAAEMPTAVTARDPQPPEEAASGDGAPPVPGDDPEVAGAGAVGDEPEAAEPPDAPEAEPPSVPEPEPAATPEAAPAAGEVIGEDGPPESSPVDEPVAVPTEDPEQDSRQRGAALVAASGYHTCAINSSGGVECWGSNNSGFRLGDPSIHQATSPVPVRGISDAVAISIGDSASDIDEGHTCVLHGDRTVSCWGSDQWGALGQGGPPASQDDRSDGDPTVPVAVRASGLALPTKVRGITDAVDVSAGGSHTCVVHADGGGSCWGDNTFGQLGDGTVQSRDWPARVPGLSDAVSISAGWIHTCALHSDGTVSCWGANGWAQLGDGTFSDRQSPVKVTGIDDAVMVSAGAEYTCVVRQSGGISCWGSNLSDYHDEAGNPVFRVGMLGTGSRETLVASPAPVLGITDAMTVDTGAFSSCALHRDGGVSCWGTNNSGQVGTGTLDDQWESVRLPGISDALAVTVSSREQWGGTHACVVSASSGVLCWGDNRYGQLGVGDTDPRLAPQPAE